MVQKLRNYTFSNPEHGTIRAPQHMMPHNNKHLFI